jgi:hypothetical protein
VSGEITGETVNHSGTWKSKHGDIMNIESEQLKRQKDENDLPYTHGVRIIMKNGRVVRMAENLDPESAAWLVATLSQALMALRFENGFPDDEGGIVY